MLAENLCLSLLLFGARCLIGISTVPFLSIYTDMSTKKWETWESKIRIKKESLIIKIIYYFCVPLCNVGA